MNWKQIINVHDPDFIEWHLDLTSLILKVWFCSGGYYRGSVTFKNGNRRSFSLADSNTVFEAKKAALRMIGYPKPFLKEKTP